jgi:hypothetical protein
MCFDRTIGEFKDVKWIFGKGSEYRFVVNGIQFEVIGSTPFYIEDGMRCTVEYLRNSKYVMGMKKMAEE